jgi:hypothetical protein
MGISRFSLYFSLLNRHLLFLRTAFFNLRRQSPLPYASPGEEHSPAVTSSTSPWPTSSNWPVPRHKHHAALFVSRSQDHGFPQFRDGLKDNGTRSPAWRELPQQDFGSSGVECEKLRGKIGLAKQAVCQQIQHMKSITSSAGTKCLMADALNFRGMHRLDYKSLRQVLWR